ncbi:hypothetical protein ACIF9R_17885 [Streptomyces sp. NPDC086080]|uniref:hypothetical protein n=1 Tax=Streptomyces sp. NPDC086080 TaxID=3365748 RepID=UPI0037CD3C32
MAPARREGTAKRVVPIVAVLVVVLAGGGAAGWALAKGGNDSAGVGNPMDHVEISDGKLVTDDGDLGYCDDDDLYSYNDCTDLSEETYEFSFEITNRGDEPANYSVIVNGFDEDGDFVAQTYIGATHLNPDRTESDKGEFSMYSSREDDERPLSDIDSIEIAHAERTPLAN